MAERRDDDIDIEEQADAVADFVEELLTQMEIDAIAEPTEQGGRIYVDILDGDDADMALLIGKHGATLDAIQELARQVVGRRLDERFRVLVDVEDYRKRRTSRWRSRLARRPSARSRLGRGAVARAHGCPRTEDRPRRGRRGRWGSDRVEGRRARPVRGRLPPSSPRRTLPAPGREGPPRMFHVKHEAWARDARAVGATLTPDQLEQLAAYVGLLVPARSPGG